MTFEKNRKKVIAFFIAAAVLICALFAVALISANSYNTAQRHLAYPGSELFGLTESSHEGGVSAVMTARDSTWTKVFDFNNEGLTEANYQAYIYDLCITNETGGSISEYSFRFSPSAEIYLASAWNGSLELHQDMRVDGTVARVPDLRDFHPDDYELDYVTVDGENFVRLSQDDYFIYYPSQSANAIEVPVGSGEAVVPGFILYLGIGDSLDNSTLDLTYKLYKPLTTDPFFKAALMALFVTILVALIVTVTSIQVRYYRARHEHDNKIIQESIETFTGFIDAKDPYTNGHSKRVAMYTKLIAEKLGYEGDELDRIYYIALLHDCGKIGIPDNILTKPGRLTDEEFEVIKSHTVKGSEILSNFSSIEGVVEGAEYHHERYDGKGYPEGRAGEDIPRIARAICVADSFDAMNSNRCYRTKLPREKIIYELEENKGKQFDPEMVDVMLKLIDEKKVID